MIAKEFETHKKPGVSISKIYRSIIFPKFFISKSTFNSILGTPIDKELKALGFTQEQIDKHVEKHNNIFLPTANFISSIADNPYMQAVSHNQIF